MPIVEATYECTYCEYVGSESEILTLAEDIARVTGISTFKRPSTPEGMRCPRCHLGEILCVEAAHEKK